MCFLGFVDVALRKSSNQLRPICLLDIFFLGPEDQRGEALALEDLLKAQLAQGLLREGIQSAKDEGLEKNAMTRWWFQTFLSNFHPYLGKITILTNIFQMGWNHQLDDIFIGFLRGVCPRGGGNWGTPRIPFGEDWGTLGNIRETPVHQPKSVGVYITINGFPIKGGMTIPHIAPGTHVLSFSK